jgi:hypothetical protein
MESKAEILGGGNRNHTQMILLSSSFKVLNWLRKKEG